MLRPVNDVFFDKKNPGMSMCVCGIVIKLAFSVFPSLPSTRRSQSRKAAVADSGFTGTCCCVVIKASCQVEVGVSKNRGGPPKWMVYNGKPY